MSLSMDLEEFILSKGAKKTGFANLADLNIRSVNCENLNFKVKSGISFLINHNPDVIRAISKGPTQEYLDDYNRLNRKLDAIALDIEKYLQSKGYNAYAQTVERTYNDYIKNNDYSNTIPHKTIATKAALGWIGKADTFVTNEFGSALRLSSVLTDAPLDYATPITASLCGMCMECRNACPGGAISGTLWNTKIDRDDFFDYKKCRETLDIVSKESLGEEFPICGRCIVVCPKTQKFIQQSSKANKKSFLSRIFG